MGGFAEARKHIAVDIGTRLMLSSLHLSASPTELDSDFNWRTVEQTNEDENPRLARFLGLRAACFSHARRGRWRTASANR
jgi:hypothetical protein